MQEREKTVQPGILKTIYTRRAVRKYKDEPVPREIIEKILDAGRMAPSALNKQPWKFFILTQKETIRSFSKAIAAVAFRVFIKSRPGKIIKTVAGLLHFKKSLFSLRSADPVFYGAPVVIFITAPRDNEWAALDIGMCSQNMMLATKALGLESCPVGFGKYVEQTRLYPKLKVPSTDTVHLALILGYGNENPDMHERNKENAVFIE